MSGAEYVTRFLPLRASQLEADERRLQGYAIVFNSLSQNLGGFVERMAPSSVDRTLREGTNVDALVDHRRETSTILGSTDSGLLRLDKDRHGLRVRIDPPDTQWVRDLITVVKAGLVKGMSFAFRIMPDGDEWEDEGGQLVRTVHDMQFSETSIVVNPAYLATEISARNAELDKRAFDTFMSSKAWKPSLALLQRELRAKRIA